MGIDLDPAVTNDAITHHRDRFTLEVITQPKLPRNRNNPGREIIRSAVIDLMFREKRDIERLLVRRAPEHLGLGRRKDATAWCLQTSRSLSLQGSAVESTVALAGKGIVVCQHAESRTVYSPRYGATPLTKPAISSQHTDSQAIVIRALALICVRNEAVHIERCIRHFIESGCDVCLIDNDSADGTLDLARQFLGHGLLDFHRLPWTGTFSLTKQLDAKRAIIEASQHDWVVHADADEWLVSPIEGQTLAEALSAADSEGFNVVNFHECVFVPTPGADHNHTDYVETMRDYYFFQPFYPRLHRAWRRDAVLDNLSKGGHIVSGADRNLSPHDLILRHYIVLSQAQANAKYLNRVFSAEDLESGWHGNRRNINAITLQLKTQPAMRRLAQPLNHSHFDLSQPVHAHFWDWPAQQCIDPDATSE